MPEENFLYLTTLGNKTGLPREIEIWFTCIGERYYLIAEHRERAKWVQNLIHQPRVSFRIADRIFHGVGRIVSETPEAELQQAVRLLFEQKYGWSNGLVVELIPSE